MTLGFAICCFQSSKSGDDGKGLEICDQEMEAKRKPETPIFAQARAGEQ